MDMQTFTQLDKSMWEEQDAVTSIEYALLGSLIVIVDGRSTMREFFGQPRRQLPVGVTAQVPRQISWSTH